jgi:hypothetical protein
VVRNPRDLYELHTDETDFGSPVMLHSLAGFLDAGSSGRLAVVQLTSLLEHRLIATFDVDALYDYRARRPRMTFLNDHYGQIDLPELTLSELRDQSGARFLLLAGPEPDFGWQGFVAAVEQIVRHFGVKLTIGMHAVPWPAPHTRPVGITTHSSDPTLLGEHRMWVGNLEVPGHVAGLLELTLGAAGHDAMGFVAHIPHYLTGVDYPRGAVALIEAVSAKTGLLLPFGDLLESAERTDAEISAQVSGSSENDDAVRALEQQYDSFVSTAVDQDPTAGPLPSADEIAAQVEQFLADLDTRGRDDN